MSNDIQDTHQIKKNEVGTQKRTLNTLINLLFTHRLRRKGEERGAAGDLQRELTPRLLLQLLPDVHRLP